ncbi:MAG: serine hydrolase [Candidatus Promineifilaceae bacterium]|nr:serine hydrolase [Candidatus Promineifilaceae bacterium]
MRRLLSRDLLLKLTAALAGTLLLVLTAWVVVAGPMTVYRVIRFGDTQIDDFRHYPGRRLSASPSPAPFPEAAGPGGVPSTIQITEGEEIPFDQMLARTDTIAFLVIEDGAIVYERYLQDHTASSPSQIFSVSKSITSLLVGAALEDGLIDSVEQPVTTFLPELADQGFDAVSLRHLLTMTSGTDYVENDNPFGTHVILNYTPNLEEEILGFQVVDEPGTVFRYKSGDNALLGLILDRLLAPRSITDYAQDTIWSPLGMEDGGVWSIDSAEDGLERTWCCLAMSARDLAKVGRLYLSDGAADGRQVVSPDWVRQSTQVGGVPTAAWPSELRAAGWRNYGYQWWLASEEAGDYFALGKDGKFLYVNPTTETIIVRLGWNLGNVAPARWIGLFQAIAREQE